MRHERSGTRTFVRTSSSTPYTVARGVRYTDIDWTRNRPSSGARQRGIAQ